MTTLIQKNKTTRTPWAYDSLLWEGMIAPSAKYDHVKLNAVTVPNDNPFKMDFMIGHGIDISEIDYQKELNKLMEYFKACLAINEKNFWVNLSPWEPNRVMPKALTETILGIHSLEQDVLLKQYSSALLHPEGKIGNQFWSELEKRIGVEKPYTMCQKIWICPAHDGIGIYKKPVGEELDPCLRELFTAGPGDLLGVLTKSELNVNISIDQLGLDKQIEAISQRKYLKRVNEVGLEVFKEWILPEIQREVREGRVFHIWRQQFEALLLATFLKNHYKDHPKLQPWIDSNKPSQSNITINNIESLKTTPKDDIAPQCWEKDLAEIQRVFGEGSPVTLRLMSAIAHKLFEAENVEAARTIQKQVLKTQQSILGEDHRDIQQSSQLLNRMLNEGGIEIDSHHSGVSTAVAISPRTKTLMSSADDKDPQQSLYDAYVMLSAKGTFSCSKPINQHLHRHYFSGGLTFQRLANIDH